VVTPAQSSGPQTSRGMPSGILKVKRSFTCKREHSLVCRRQEPLNCFTYSDRRRIPAELWVVEALEVYAAVVVTTVTVFAVLATSALGAEAYGISDLDGRHCKCTNFTSKQATDRNSEAQIIPLEPMALTTPITSCPGTCGYLEPCETGEVGIEGHTQQHSTRLPTTKNIHLLPNHRRSARQPQK
jgi:hypothetical protein